LPSWCLIVHYRYLKLGMANNIEGYKISDLAFIIYSAVISCVLPCNDVPILACVQSVHSLINKHILLHTK
jgi:hypothetical protein